MAIKQITIERDKVEWVFVNEKKMIALYDDGLYLACVEEGYDDKFISGEYFCMCFWRKSNVDIKITGELVGGKKGSIVKESEYIPMTIEEIALEVQKNRTNPLFSYKYDYSGTTYEGGVGHYYKPHNYLYALRKDKDDETPLNELEWKQFMKLNKGA